MKKQKDILSRDNQISTLREILKLVCEKEKYLTNIAFDHDIEPAAKDLINGLRMTIGDCLSVAFLKDTEDLKNQPYERDYNDYVDASYIRR